MADSPAAGGGFDFYEGIRIAVPGALVVGLVAAVAATFDVPFPSLSDNTVGGAVAAVLVGLVLYYVDAPAKAAVFQPLLPTSHMRAWNLKTKNGLQTLNVYFVLLDELMPAGLKARALYMGSMYRIGLEAIYLVGGTAAGVLTAAGLRAAHGARVPGSPDRGPLVAATVTVALLPFAAVVLDRRRIIQRRRLSGDDAAPWPRDRRHADVYFLVAAVAVQGWFLADPRLHATAAHCVTVAVVLYWAVRYFRGVRQADRSRLPLTRTAATFVYALAFGPLLLDAAVVLPRRGAAATSAVGGWAAAVVVAGALVCSRGHEKRLRGAYATQNTWLDLNRETVVDKYFVVPENPTAPPAPPAPPTRPPASRLPRWLKRFLLWLAEL